MKIGANGANLRVGSNKIDKIYQGTTEVYNSGLKATAVNMVKTQDGTGLYGSITGRYYTQYSSSNMPLVIVDPGSSSAVPPNTGEVTQYANGYIELPYTANQLVEGGKQSRSGNYNYSVNTIIFGIKSSEGFRPVITGMGKHSYADSYSYYRTTGTSAQLTYGSVFNQAIERNILYISGSTSNLTNNTKTSITHEVTRSYGSLAQLYKTGDSAYTLIYTTVNSLASVSLTGSAYDQINCVRILPTYGVGLNSTYPFLYSTIGLYNKDSVITADIFNESSLGINLIAGWEYINISS